MRWLRIWRLAMPVLLFSLLVGGMWGTVVHVRASAPSGRQQVYTFSDMASTAMSRLQQAPCSDDPYEPNNWFDQATPVVFDVAYTASVCNSDDLDYFRFDLTAGQQVIIDLYNMELNSNLELYSPDQTLITTSANAGSAPEQIVYTATQSGTYYAVVWGTENELPNPYTLRVHLATPSTPTPSPPTLPPGLIMHFGADGQTLGSLVTEGTPGDLATDMLGHLFVRINQNHRIVHYNTMGEVLGSWTTDGEPGAITVGPEGQVYVKINQNHRVAIYSSAGEWLGEIDTGVEASDIAAGPDGSLYVAIPSDHRIVRYGATGQVIGSWETPGAPERIVVTGVDRVAVKINQNHLFARGEGTSPWLIATYTPSGEIVGEFPLDTEPVDLAGSPDGSLFVPLGQEHRVLRYSATGELLASWTTDMAPASAAGDREAGVWMIMQGDFTRGELVLGAEVQPPETGALRIGDVITVTLDVRQVGGETVMDGIVLTHPVPTELLFVAGPTVEVMSGDFTPATAGYDPEFQPRGVVQWEGSMGPNAHGRIQYRARVMGCPQDYYDDSGTPVMKVRADITGPNGLRGTARVQVPVDCTPPNPEAGEFEFTKSTSLSPGQKVQVGDEVIYILDVYELSGTGPVTNPARSQIIGPITVADYLPPQLKIAYRNGQPRVADWEIIPTVFTFARTVWPPRIVGWRAYVTPGAHARYGYAARVVSCPPADAQGRHIIRNVAKLGLPNGQVLTATAEIEVDCPERPDPKIRLSKRMRIPRLQTGPPARPRAAQVDEVTPFTRQDTPVFEIELSNEDDLDYSVIVTDTLPEGLAAIDASVEVGEARIEDDGRTVVWNVDSQPGSRSRMIVYTRPDFRLKCAEELLNRAVASTERAQGGRFVVYSNAVRARLTCEDLGDAPTSLNHAGRIMEAYPGVTAHFPTVFDPALGGPQGPRHNFAWQDAWLGYGVSSERDADQPPDEDILTNIDGLAGRFNQDRWDDGLRLSGMPKHCAVTTATVIVTVKGQERTRYLNLWFDWNRDGDWEDVLECPTDTGSVFVREWAVRDFAINLGPGVHQVAVPAFLAYNPDGDRPMWARVTLSESPAPVNPATGLADGRGPASGYLYGETEDYFLGTDGATSLASDVAVGQVSRTWLTRYSGVRYVALGWGIVYTNLGPASAPTATLTIHSPSLAAAGGWTVQTAPHLTRVSATHDTESYAIQRLSVGQRGLAVVTARVPFTTPPGTVFTNTTSISAARDPDLTNNTSVVTVTVPLMPPEITFPPNGTTCRTQITVTGRSQTGVFVDLYADGIYTATTTVDNQGNWDVPMTLPDGTHTFYAKARTVQGGESQRSKEIKIIVDSRLLWDPITLYTMQWNGMHRYPDMPVQNDKGRMDPGNLHFHLRENVPTTHVGVRVRVCGKKRIDSIVLKIDGQPARNLTDPDGDNVYKVKFAATAQDIRNMKGKKVQLCVTSGSIRQCTDGKVTIDPEGWIFDLVNNTLVAGSTVSLLQSQPQLPGQPFTLWDAATYGQTNPQNTGPDGHFAFFTPPGTYRLQVTKDGYQPYLSPDLTVVTRPVRYDIPLTPQITETPVITITVDDQGFHPAVVTVPPGSVVAWQNMALKPHGSVSIEPAVQCEVCPSRSAVADAWDSGLLPPGQTYRWRVKREGMYTYRDPAHPLHAGVLIVQTTRQRLLYLPALLR